MSSRCLRPLLAAAVLLCACDREERDVRPPPATAARTENVVLSALQPGQERPKPSIPNSYEHNAFALSEGKRLYKTYNCNGCHANGGGGMGPPLMDAKWIYGSEPANIFATIIQGRPNGMPSFGGKIPDYQIWQLAAYVRSLSGQAPMDAAPARSDHMNVKKPESQTTKETPQNVSVPSPTTNPQ